MQGAETAEIVGLVAAPGIRFVECEHGLELHANREDRGIDLVGAGGSNPVRAGALWAQPAGANGPRPHGCELTR